MGPEAHPREKSKRRVGLGMGSLQVERVLCVIVLMALD